MQTANAVSQKPLPDDLVRLYLDGAFKDVAELEALQGRLAADLSTWDVCQARMREIAHNVQGQGTSFGYPLMTRVGRSLSKLLKTTNEERGYSTALLAAHVKTLRTVLDKDIQGSGGDLGETIASRLEVLVESGA